MNKLQFLGHWNQIKGKVKEKFGKLTDDDFLKINGKRDELVGKLQTLYGINKESIDEKLKEIEHTYYSDELKNHWKEIQAQLKQKWNDLTEDDIQRIKGRSDLLITQLEERYQFDRVQAENEFHSFIESINTAREKVGAHSKEQRR